MRGLRICAAAVAVTFVAGAALADRVVSLGGSVTEIIYALGEEHRLVARDTTSTWPVQAQDLPDVGYIRRLSAEGVLSVAPDLILSEAGAGPQETLELLQAASIPFVTLPEGFSVDAVVAKITGVAGALGVEDKGAQLAARVAKEFQQAQELAQDVPPQRVLFVLSLAGGRVTAAGENTSAAAIIALAGGINAMAGVEGYKQMSDEAILAARPDVILMMDRTGDHAITDEALLSHPALASSPAAQSGTVLRMDGLLLLGFGPRVGKAIADLAAQLAGVGG